MRAERGVCGGQMREAGMMRSLREKGALHAVNAAIASRVMCGLATLRRQRSRRAHAVCDLHVCACVDRPRTNMQCDCPYPGFVSGSQADSFHMPSCSFIEWYAMVVGGVSDLASCRVFPTMPRFGDPGPSSGP